MDTVMKEFEHLKIHLEELKKATDSFRSKVIGKGGFGKVYEGEVSHSKGRSMAAIKRLSREFGQGEPEFLKEILMLSRYTHKNLISLLGFCDEDGEKILVYEHASNGSLDRHLSSSALTWTQRLKICLDVANGLAYLHHHKGTEQRVFHRDIKSANILLDENWNAKISDMGLSKLGPAANQPHTVLFTQVVGTPGYCDPQYLSTYTLTKESDIYSFGVVLFEVLCGKLCFTHTNNQFEILVPMWKESYKANKLDMIIFKDLMPHINPTSLETFSNIAFQCLHYSREQRPTTYILVEKLEIAHVFQERHDMKLTNDAETFQKASHVDKLIALLFKGKMEREGAQEKYGKGSTSSAAIAEKGAAPAQADVTVEAIARLVHCEDGTSRLTIDDLLKANVKVIGRSTYGIHYKVTMENGDQVAVYRFGDTTTKNPREMEDELNLVGRIRHPNLLAVMAYYLGLKEKFLVHDYMPNKRLSDYLIYADLRPGKWIDWPTRMQIAKGVARGLLCLHTHHNIIHGNLTSYNVWLDENLNPKISEFGLSLSSNMLLPRFPSYWDPELKNNNHKPNKETDIYSLGMIMLEIVTGELPPPRDLGPSRWVAFVKNMVHDKDGFNKLFRHKLMTDVMNWEQSKNYQILL